MEAKATSEDGATVAITYNTPSNADRAEFGEEANFTLNSGPATIYFDEIKQTLGGFAFRKNGDEVAWLSEEDCTVSPVAALSVAERNPNETAPIAD